MTPPPAPKLCPRCPTRPGTGRRAALLAAGVLAAAAHAQTPRFDLIQPGPGYRYSIVSSLLDDGRAGGWSFGSFPGEDSGRPFLWDPNDGRTDLQFPDGYDSVFAQFAADGSAYVALSRLHQRIGGGYSIIEPVPGYPDVSSYDITRDGRMVVGSSKFSSFGSTVGVALLWREGIGTFRLPALPGGSYLNEARAVSDDGRFVSGGGTIGPGYYTAWIWNETTGYTILPNEDGSFGDSIANGISNDGRVAVGSTTFGRAARWVDGQIELLGSMPGFVSFEALGVSGDGRIIVGHATIAGGGAKAFVWTEHTGMMLMGDFLRSTGLDVSDELAFVRPVVSSDGTRIGGNTGTTTTSFGFSATVPAPGGAMVGLLLAPLTLCRIRPAPRAIQRPRTALAPSAA